MIEAVIRILGSIAIGILLNLVWQKVRNRK